MKKHNKIHAPSSVANEIDSTPDLQTVPTGDYHVAENSQPAASGQPSTRVIQRTCGTSQDLLYVPHIPPPLRLPPPPHRPPPRDVPPDFPQAVAIEVSSLAEGIPCGDMYRYHDKTAPPCFQEHPQYTPLAGYPSETERPSFGELPQKDHSIGYDCEIGRPCLNWVPPTSNLQVPSTKGYGKHARRDAETTSALCGTGPAHDNNILPSSMLGKGDVVKLGLPFEGHGAPWASILGGKGLLPDDSSLQSRTFGGKNENKDESVDPWFKWQKDGGKRAGVRAKHRGEDEEWSFETAHIKNMKFLDTLEQALKESVVQAELLDGTYYVKKTDNNPCFAIPAEFWCRLCGEAIARNGLAPHLDNERHRHRVDASGDVSGLLPWQERSECGSFIRCIPCKKFCDGFHDQAGEHRRKIDDWYRFRRTDFVAPQEEWLAFVTGVEAGRCLRCLLCQKWVNDFDGKDTAYYIQGEHSRFREKHCKEHKRRVRFLRSLKKDLLAEKAIWHPPEYTQPEAALATKDTSQRGSNEVLEIPVMPPPSFPPPQNDISSAAAIARLPKGWYKAWCEYYERDYYYRERGPTQWAFPCC